MTLKVILNIGHPMRALPLLPLLSGLLLGTSALASPQASEPDVSEPPAETTQESPSDAAADPSEAAPPPAAIVPPVPLEQPELIHPLPDDEARALGVARVVVVITIAADGSVSDATLVEEASHEDPRLREAALDVARRTRFTPATRDGAPIAVQLPLGLTFQPPPEPVPPLLDELSLDVTSPGSALEPGAAPRPFDPFALGQSLAVGGGLVLGASVLFTTFSGVTALDNAARQEELAKSVDEQAAAERTRSYGGAMLIPFAGPFLALPNAPDASTSLFTALGGVAHVVGAALVVTGGALMLAPLFAAPDEATEQAE